MHGLACLGIQTSRSFQLLFRWSYTGKKLSQKSGVHQIVANCCSCNIFPKFQKFLGPSFCLNQFDFLLWFDLMIFQKGLSNALDWSTTCFSFSSNAWNNPLCVQTLSLLLITFSARLNQNFIWLVLPPLRRNNKSWLRLFFWYVWLNRLSFGFK